MQGIKTKTLLNNKLIHHKLILCKCVNNIPKSWASNIYILGKHLMSLPVGSVMLNDMSYFANKHAEVQSDNVVMLWLIDKEIMLELCKTTRMMIS